MSSFGERFKNMRLSKGMTQEELAEDFNRVYGYAFSKTSISHYENNRRVPEMKAIRKFVDYFAVSLDYLLCNDLKDVNDIIDIKSTEGNVKYVEVNEVAALIKSLVEDELMLLSGNKMSLEQGKVLVNGVEVIMGILSRME